MKKSLVLMALLGFVLSAKADSVHSADAQQMQQGLDFINSIFQVEYAPKQWKQNFASWSLDKEIKTAKAEINTNPQMPLRDYQKLISKFFNSMKDYHVSVSFHSTEKASLPLDIRSAGGHYFIAWIDRDKLSEMAFPFSVGDEVLSMDSRPIAEIAKELKDGLGGNTDGTDRMLAEMRLTKRSAARALDVPRGPVTLEILPAMSSKVYKTQLIWNYTPEKVRFSQPANIALTQQERLHKFFDGQMITGLQSEFALWNKETATSPFNVGARKSFIPALGTKLWETEETNPFYAYLYRSDEGKILGYIRIPSYGAGEKESLAFAKIMAHFARTTDGLIIDQVNNPGGSVFYLYSLVSMLTDQAFTTPRHRMALNQGEIVEALESIEALKDVKTDADAQKLLGVTIGGYPVNYQVAVFMREYAQNLINDWDKGETLTAPYYLGVDRINPHPLVNYTKPVLLLTNELDFSGGDFFPAILQDNKRVTILGTRTAGAGGYVHQLQYPNHLGIASFTATASLAERVDKNPIENLGVTPDFNYQLTAADYQMGFKGYTRAIKAAIKDMVK